MATYLADPLFEDDDLEPIDVAFEASSLGPSTDELPINEATGFPMLSRRAMLGGVFASALAASGMMLLPKERGGVLFAGFSPFGAGKAYATDEIWSGTFSFRVVGADEVGFQIMDVSDLSDYDESQIEKKGIPVEGATVTLKSRSNKATISDQTDEEGKVIFPIRSLALEDNPPDGVYRANVSIKVTTEDARVKMRDFSAGRVCLEGASGIVIGTHKTDDTDVYLECLTFNDWDIHYSKLTFLRSSDNTSDHTVFARIKGATEDVKLSMEVLDAETKEVVLKKRETTAEYDSKSGLAEGSFEGKFLQAGHKDCFSKDDVILRITLSVGGTDYVTDSEMFLEDIPISDVVANAPIIPFTSDAGTLFNFTASTNWPFFKGLGFSVLAPFPLVQVSSTLLTTCVGFGTDLHMRDDNNNWNPKNFWTEHKGNIRSRYDRTMKRKTDDYNKRREARKNVEMYDLGNPEPQAAANKTKFLSNSEFNILGRLVLLFQYDGFDNQSAERKTTFSGQGTVELGVTASGTLTVETVAGGLPLFLSMTLGLTLMAAYTVATAFSELATVKEIDCSKPSWKLNDSLGIYFKVFFNISAGVGVKGVASISLDGSVAFPMYFGWLQDGGEGKEDPHITIGVTLLVEIVVQLILFRVSARLASYEKKDWYDNWNTTAESPALTGEDAWSGIEPRFKLTHPGETEPRYTVVYDNDGRVANGVVDPFDAAAPTTDAMMKGSREANASKKDGVEGADEVDAAAQSARFVPVDNETGVFRRADGTTVYVDKIPKAVVRENGDVETELVDCPGVNTFHFGEPFAGMASASAGGANAPAATRPVKGGAASVDDTDANAEAASTVLMAGSIAAQSGEAFGGDRMLGFGLGVTEEYVYDFAALNKTTGNPCGPNGVETIGDHDGVVPKVNAIIYRDVHSDPRQRIVVIGGKPYLFRVMTVQYPVDNGVACRSRVAASAYDDATGTWGVPKVLEYNSGDRDLPRLSIYDYEFDIVVRSGDKLWTQGAEACLIVTGGLRPNGDQTKFHEAASCGTVAVLAIDKDLNVLVRSVNKVKQDGESSGFFDDDQEHMACSPCIVDGFAPNGASGSIAFAFLRRSASDSTLLATSQATVTFCVGHCYMRDSHLSIPWDVKEGPNLSADVFGVKGVAGAAVAKKYDALFTLLLTHQNGYDVCTATIPPGEDFSKLKITHCIQGTDKLPELQPWHKHGTFLFTKERPTSEDDDNSTPDYHLYQGTFEVDTPGQTGFGEKQVDMAGLKGSSFSVSPSGEFLFYYESYTDKKGDAPEADYASGNVTGTGDDSVRHIMASRLMDGKFSEDFPFCEVDHPIDQLELLNIEEEASSFIATHIKDPDNSLADVHYIGVPNTIAAEITAFVQSVPFVCAGQKCPFQVDVHNKGNMIICGFKLQMVDPASGEVIGTVDEGQIEPSKISPTAANMGWGPTSSDTPVLTSEEKQGLLMPGKKMSYGVEFDIPSTWEGTKAVILRIIDAWAPRMRAAGVAAASADMKAMADSFTEEEGGLVIRGLDGVVHYYHKGKVGDVVLSDAGSGEGVLYDPDEMVVRIKSSPDNPNSSGGGSGKSAKTGDNLGPWGPLALAAAGAAALAAGYSARRLQNEHEAREANEEEE